LTGLADIDWARLRAVSHRSGRYRSFRQAGPRGRYVRAKPLGDSATISASATELALDATLRAAARRAAESPEQRASTGQGGGGSQLIVPSDLRQKIRFRPRSTLVVFVVDASDSMGKDARMTAAKGAALALLTTAYQRRDRVALVIFEGQHATVALRPTSSVVLARRRLRRLPVGGATPLADGLSRAWQLVKVERLRDPQLDPLLVLISDGEANVPLRLGNDINAELHLLGQTITRGGVRSIIIDTAARYARSARMIQLAKSLSATYHQIRAPGAAHVVRVVRSLQT